ncbi:MAG: hypothetical protein ABSG80_17060 [Verrucomicrobiota bacterium]|jgi:hypothetical protein
MYHASVQIPPHAAMSIPHYIGIAAGWGVVLIVAFFIIFLWLCIRVITQSNRINDLIATIGRIEREKTTIYETTKGDRFYGRPENRDFLRERGAQRVRSMLNSFRDPGRQHGNSNA